MAGGGLTLGGRGDFRGAQWIGQARVKGRTQWQKMALLTVSLLGLQLVWSTEMSQASPYLLSLGLSKSLMAMVFLAGPLSGLIVQPLIGIFADRCKSPLGRRRPYIIGGCVVTVVSLLVFGYTREVASLFAKRGTERHARVTVWLAVASVYTLDFSINAVQASDRSLLVDTLPPSQQPIANAWAGRLIGIGAISGFWLSNVDLTSVPLLRLFGDSQLKILSVIAAFWFAATHMITCCAVEERVLLEDDHDFDEPARSGVSGAVKQIWRTWRGLPKGIKEICEVQFFSWIGWFPIMFFSTTWIAEIWFRTQGAPADLAAASPAMIEAATRAGSRAMLLHAVASFVAAVVLPVFVSSSSPVASARWNPPRASDSSLVDALWHVLWRLRVKLPDLPLRWLGLTGLWAWSQAFFALMMFASVLVGSVGWGTLVIGATGFCWAVTMWAPFALLGEAILNDGTPKSLNGSTVRLSLGYRPPLTPIVEESTATLESFAMTPRPPQPDRQRSEKCDAAFPAAGGERPYLGVSGSAKSSRDTLGTRSKEGSSERFATPMGYDSPPMTGDVIHVRHSDSLDLDQSEREALTRATVHEGSAASMLEARREEAAERAELEREFEAFDGDVDGVTEENTADMAGVILGIHNIYVVLPQFLVTFLSSVIFAFLAPGKPAFPGHSALIAPTPSTAEVAGDLTGGLAATVRRAVEAEGSKLGGGPDAIGWIFRIGGLSAAVGAWKCWKMAKRRDRASGFGLGRYRSVPDS